MTEITIIEQLQLPTGFFVRVNEHEGYEETLRSLHETHADYSRLLCVRHVGKFKENPHFHFAVDITKEMKPETFRARMKKLFNKDKGNAHMSIKSWDGSEKVLSYMLHEDPVIIINQYGHTDEDVKRYAALDADVKKAYKRTGCSSSTQFMTQQAIDAFDKLVTQYKAGDHGRDNFESIPSMSLSNGYPKEKDTCFIIWDICKERQINFPSKFNLKSICNRVQAHYARGEANWFQLKNEWYQEMFG